MNPSSLRSVPRLLAVGLLLSGAAYAQQSVLQVADSGEVIAAHQRHHRRKGQKVTWTRQTGAKKSWYVQFAESPCAEGSKFGSDGAKVCTISVPCNAPGDAACKAYKYSTGLSASGPLHDPQIIVDP